MAQRQCVGAVRARRVASEANDLRRDALRLYRHIVRTAYALPDRNARIYYLDHARGHFDQHADESDPERIRALIERGFADTQVRVSESCSGILRPIPKLICDATMPIKWIIKKYKLDA